MSYPPRTFFTVAKLSARWGCSPADIAGWAASDLLSMVISIAAAFCGKKPLSGIVIVSAADMMQMFRRHGPSDEECRVFRVQQKGSAEWLYVTDPAAGVQIKQGDLLLMADEVRRFEDERDLMRRPASTTGASTRYPWEAMYISLILRVHERGLPATQAEFIAEVQEWFTQNSPSGEIPEESTTRKKIAPIWQALR